MINIQNISKIYGTAKVLNIQGLTIPKGETFGLVGNNGAGKTTTFYMIVGLIKPLAGNIFLENLDITDEPMYKRAQKGIGYLPQEASKLMEFK